MTHRTINGSADGGHRLVATRRGRSVLPPPSLAPAAARGFRRRFRRQVTSLHKMWASHLAVAKRIDSGNGRLNSEILPMLRGTNAGDTNAAQVALGGFNQLGPSVYHAMDSLMAMSILVTKPLPGPYMVAARSSFEAAQRVIWALEPVADLRERVCRLAAVELENEREARRALARYSPKEAKPFAQALEERAAKTDALLASAQIDVERSRRHIVIRDGERSVQVPINVTGLAEKWRGLDSSGFYARLSGYTHGLTWALRGGPSPDAASLSMADAAATGLVVAGACQEAVSLFDLWIGIPDGMVMKRFVKVIESCAEASRTLREAGGRSGVSGPEAGRAQPHHQR